MADRAERRRLATILADEDYGPRLARLGRADETRVLKLISDNKGREARKEILELDAKRVGKRRTLTRVKRFVKLSPADRSRTWAEEMELLTDDEKMEIFWDNYDSLML